jgi:hypothetical protein
MFKQGVGVTLWPCRFTFKKYIKAKEELWKLKYISPCKNIVFKKSSERNQNPSRYYNSMKTENWVIGSHEAASQEPSKNERYNLPENCPQRLN